MNWALMRLLGKHVEHNKLLCFLVGGAVRDDLTGKEPKDYDFVCDDSEKLIGILEENYPDTLHVKRFKKYGTYQFKLLGEDIEFVNPRKEAYMTWSYKPKCTPGTMKDDIMRRDFTINTLAYSVFDSSYNGADLVDVTGRGKADLHAKRLDCVGDPLKTFFEDPSRLIRLCIYAAKGFNLTPKTYSAAMVLAKEIKRVPQEAIRQMMDKGIVINGFIRWMYSLGILQYIMPELTDLNTYEQPQKHHLHNVWEHTLAVIDHCDNDKILRWAALFHDIGKAVTWDERENYHGHEFESEKLTQRIVLRMRFSNEDMREILHLVRHHMKATLTAIHNTVSKRSIGRFFRKHEKYLGRLFRLTKADIKGSGVHVAGDLQKVNDFFDKVFELRQTIGVFEDNQFKFRLDYSGSDIMKAMNIRPSPLVGEIKEIIEKRVCSGELENDWNAIDDFIQSYKI